MEPSGATQGGLVCSEKSGEGQVQALFGSQERTSPGIGVFGKETSEVEEENRGCFKVLLPPSHPFDS